VRAAAGGRCYARRPHGASSDPDASILAGVHRRFEESTDFTIGLEEEYQILDPASLALTNRFEDLMAAADADLPPALAGELIAQRDRVPATGQARQLPGRGP